MYTYQNKTSENNSSESFPRIDTDLMNRSGDDQLNREELLKQKKQYVYDKLDQVKFNVFHVKALFITGLGFFTDMYDLFAINLVMLMMTHVYCHTSSDDLPPGYVFCPYSNSSDETCGEDKSHKHQLSLPPIIDTSVKASGIFGVAFGQFVFGILGDRYGRTRMYGAVLAVMIVGTFGSSFSSSTISGLNVFSVLIIWRVILGVGIGGDFPLSAIIASEFSNIKRRGSMIAAVNAMQGLGILTQALVALITLAAFKTSIQQDTANLDYVWRILLGLGTVPAVVALFSRINIPETPRFTIEIDNDYERAAIDVDIVFDGKKRTNYSVKREGENRPTFIEFCSFFYNRNQIKLLLGIVIPRFALNVAFYGINLNSGIILQAIGFGVSDDIYTTVFNNAVGQIVIALISSIPGYFLSVYLIEKIGRRKLQMIGFFGLTILYIVLGSAYHQIRCTSTWLFIAIYIIAQYFCNIGPNTTVFVIPAEVFPTKFRSTAYGLSASIGKVGAAIAEIGFFRLKDVHGTSNSGLPLIILIFAAFMFIGFIFTFLLPETRGLTLEEITDLVANGGKEKNSEPSSKLNDVSKSTVNNTKL